MKLWVISINCKEDLTIVVTRGFWQRTLNAVRLGILENSGYFIC